MKGTLSIVRGRVTVPSTSKSLLYLNIFFYYSKNGNIFEGEWKNHVKDGFGTYIYPGSGRSERLLYREGKIIN